MRTIDWLAPSTLLGLALLACGGGTTPTTPTGLLAAAKGTDRPFTGSCTLAVAPRVHEEDEGGACGGGDEGGGEAGGGPPIARHFDLTGSCQLSHLGRADLVGRLNITGPFQAGHGAAGDGGTLGVRGRLLFIATNGDQLAGRYVPVTAVFTPAGNGDGGTIRFTSTQRIGESCSGGDGHGGMGGGGEGEDGDHEEPTSSGRFAAALGEASLHGELTVSKATGAGSGTLVIPTGLLSY